MTLYINACVREDSRTDQLACTLLEKLGEPYRERRLSEMGLRPLSREGLCRRGTLLEAGDLEAEDFALAREFAAAETIAVAAPYWDMSFPAALKLYIENIYITGIVSRYGEDGRPQGLCRGKCLYYVTTAGGPYDGRYSYDYFRELCHVYLGIRETRLIKAEMLDVQGMDAAALLEAAKAKIRAGDF